MRNLENQRNQLPSEVVVLDAGKLVEQGSPSDLLTPDDGRTGLPAGFCDVEVLAEMGFSHGFHPSFLQIIAMLGGTALGRWRLLVPHRNGRLAL